MQVEYTNTKKDAIALLWACSLSDLCWQSLSPYLYVLLKSIVIFLFYTQTNFGPFFKVACIGLFIGYQLELFYLLIKSAKFHKITAEIIIARITEDYFEVSSPLSSSRTSWSAYSRFVELRSHIVLFISPLHAYVIPKTAFKTPEEAQEFSDFIRKHVRRENLKTEVSLDSDFSLDQSRPVWGNSIKKSIQAQCTMQQWARAGLFGVSKKSYKNRPGWPYFFRSFSRVILPLSLFAFTIFYFTYETDPIPDHFSVFLLCVPTIIQHASNWFRFRLRCKRIPEHHLEPFEIQVYTQGLGFISKSRIAWLNWRSVESFVQDEELIAMYGNFSLIYCLIPQSSFANPIEAANTFEMIQDLHLLAKDQQADGDEDTSLPTTPDTGNPYQSPEYE